MSIAIQESSISDTECVPMVIHLEPVLNLSDEQLFDFCQANRDLRIERNKQGELIIMPPAGSETGSRNLEIAVQLGVWTKRDGTGKAFDSSAGFTLPNGAMRSSDAAWLRLTRWKALTAAQRKKFAPLCPDFVLERALSTDGLKALQEKMREYIQNGAKMGLLVDPEQRRVHVYRPGRKVQVLKDPKTVACDPVLPGFVLELREIW